MSADDIGNRFSIDWSSKNFDERYALKGRFEMIIFYLKLDLKTDLKSARQDASNGIPNEEIGPILKNSIFQVVGNLR